MLSLFHVPNRKLINKSRLRWAECKGSQIPGPGSSPEDPCLSQVSRWTLQHLPPAETPPGASSLASSGAGAAGAESCAFPLPSRTHLCPAVPVPVAAPRSCHHAPGSRAAPQPVPARCAFPAAPHEDGDPHYGSCRQQQRDKERE